ncbi:DinB family protein [Gordonia hongkongensis]|uniref:DinB family protein n=1 Tax=Gordonia hongkongensis TaxID=1701090 RepID=A0AAX3T7A8_9ACTN|nr:MULTISPECIES: DinB family protein [Gordonia]MBR7192534.1 DinB family protein [Gordonia sp. SCSIO 19800]QIK45956.1 DinB family protein [Gordonia terrae]UPG68471.1 DinB family protein [Gordonia hongkongensis]WFP25080.1 DinB family protein [Gordonia hongkongensis]
MSTYTSTELSVDVTGEKRDLLILLQDQRNMLKITARNLSDDDARKQSTVSTLTIGALIKHLAHGEENAARVITERDENAEFDMSQAMTEYEMTGDETLAGWLTAYDRGAAEFDRVIADAESLDELIPQPTAPWQPEREWLSIRAMIIHLIRETAHHCGHADIIREALDGQTTMGAISEGQEWAEQWADADWAK